MTLLQSQVHGAEVCPLVHDVELQGEGGAIQGVLRAAAVILTHTHTQLPLLEIAKMVREVFTLSGQNPQL